jgi:hypothetical protein
MISLTVAYQFHVIFIQLQFQCTQNCLLLNVNTYIQKYDRIEFPHVQNCMHIIHKHIIAVTHTGTEIYTKCTVTWLHSLYHFLRK